MTWTEFKKTWEEIDFPFTLEPSNAGTPDTIFFTDEEDTETQMIELSSITKLTFQEEEKAMDIHIDNGNGQEVSYTVMGTLYAVCLGPII